MNFHQSAFLAISFFLANTAVNAADQEVSVRPRPLINAHAHNDYHHQRPLLDALDQGFTSIEADVFLVDGQLLVAHSFLEVSADKTLEKLYLQPLHDLAEKNGGRIFPDGPVVTLLVDIKTNGKAAWEALNKLLASHAGIFSRTADGVFTEKAVTVIISGDRATADIQASNPRYAGIDGRLSDLDSDKPASLLPLISDHWSTHFRFRGDGEMSAEEKEKLRAIVMKAHTKGRRVRFWATPEQPAFWKELRAADVDLIGSDDLEKLSNFLRE